MVWASLTTPQMKNSFTCFECSSTAEHAHHVVPKVLGGIRTIPLCRECHGKIHAMKLNASELIKAGLAKARLRGKRIGRPPWLDASGKVEKIRELRAAGYSYMEIRIALNTASSTIKNALKNPGQGYQPGFGIELGEDNTLGADSSVKHLSPKIAE